MQPKAKLNVVEEMTGLRCPCSSEETCKGGYFGKPCSVAHCKEYDKYFCNSWDVLRGMFVKVRTI